MSKIISFEQLSKVRERHAKQRIVQCHGVFDLFHYGHLLHLQSAKSHGDILVLTLTPDRFVNKGPGRPYNNESKRLSFLAALEIVDYVCLNNSPEAVPAILALRPNYYVKGPDYAQKDKDITGGINREEDAVKAGGGELVITRDEVQSSSHLINRFMSHWDDEQREMLDTIKSTMEPADAIREIDALSELKILVVGEPIVDTYVFCRADGISSKSPTISASYLYEENYTGGSLAIANHMAALGAKVSLLIAHGNEPYFRELLKHSLHPEVQLHEVLLTNVATPRKTRYMVPFRSQRIFELQNVGHDHWKDNNSRIYRDALKNLSSQNELTIMADFGHGLFEGAVLSTVQEVDNFLALNVQSNSGNFGFNPFTKYERYNYLSIDERESRIALQDRATPIDELAAKVASFQVDRPTSITLGSRGSLYFDELGERYFCPTFFKEIVDSTGAGDAYFALTSALVYMETPQILVPFLGNCCAGLKTLIQGNKHAVSKTDLLRTVTALLK